MVLLPSLLIPLKSWLEVPIDRSQGRMQPWYSVGVATFSQLPGVCPATKMLLLRPCCITRWDKPLPFIYAISEWSPSWGRIVGLQLEAHIPFLPYNTAFSLLLLQPSQLASGKLGLRSQKKQKVLSGECRESQTEVGKAKSFTL